MKKFDLDDLLRFIDGAIENCPESKPILLTVKYRAELLKEALV